MSALAKHWAWTTDTKNASHKLLLIALAERAGDDHTVYPTMETLVSDIGQTEQTIKQNMVELQDEGLISFVGYQGGETPRAGYRLEIPNIPAAVIE